MGDLYRFIGGDLFSLSQNKVLVHNTDHDLSQVKLKSVVEILTSCKEFKTLDNHAHEYLRKKQLKLSTSQAKTLGHKAFKKLASILNKKNIEIPIPIKDVQKIRGLLENLVTDGLLISKKNFLKICMMLFLNIIL